MNSNENRTMSIQAAAAMKTKGIGEHLTALRRRRWPMLLAFGGVLACALLAALFWPATYKASGTILIEQQEVPSELVRSSISSYADQRIQIITQRVMTTDNLFKIIERFGLYAKKRKTNAREVIIQRMRDDIKFQMISADVIDPRSGNPTKASIAFSVSYQNRSAELAAKVANELVSLYLQENLESRKRSAAGAESFLNDEAMRLSTQIDELQTKVATFKERHVNELPELSQLNVQLMNRTEDDLREIDSRLRSLDQQTTYLDAQLAQLTPSSQVYTSTGERVLSPKDRLKFLRTEYARVSALYSADHPDVLRYKREIEGLQRTVGEVGSDNDHDRQSLDAKAQLASARERYGDSHPDVLRLQRLVAGLEKEIPANASNVVAMEHREDADNPAYIQVKAQREATGNERASLEKNRQQLKSRLAEFEQRLQKAPMVEHEYLSLTRELDNSQLKYREVRQKQMEAQVSENLETERKGERFSLIEPPLVPEEPASPNRLVIIVLGFVLGIGAAIGTMALLEALDTSVRSRRDLFELLSVSPLAVLPWVETESDRAHRRKIRRYSLASSLAAFATAIVLVHVFYRPLDVLWQVALRRIAG